MVEPGDRYPADSQHVDSEVAGDNISGTFLTCPCGAINAKASLAVQMAMATDGRINRHLPADLSQWNDTDSDGFGDS